MEELSQPELPEIVEISPFALWWKMARDLTRSDRGKDNPAARQSPHRQTPLVCDTPSASQPQPVGPLFIRCASISGTWSIRSTR